MSMDKEKEYINTIKKCQRNWDLTRTIPQEHINHWLWIAQNAPSKQHEAYYDVYFIRKAEVIKEMMDYTWGFTATTTPPSCWRNPQMGANFYMCFVSKYPKTMRNYNTDGSGRDTYIGFNSGGNTIGNFPSQAANGGSFRTIECKAYRMGGLGVGDSAKKLHY